MYDVPRRTPASLRWPLASGTSGADTGARQAERTPPLAEHPMQLNLTVPYLTAEIPGIGGTIKAIPSDFEVEEIPSYEPCGSGDHLFLWVEKRGVAAETLTRHIANALEIQTGEVGVAGMKDRHALTRQYVSVPRATQQRIDRINSSDIQVLSSQPHNQKLRTGQLRGNRFRILVRDASRDGVPRSDRVRAELQRVGLPNFFGAQRFGRTQETALLGMKLLRGELDSPPTHWSRKRFMRKLALSAGQAVLFNRYLTVRHQDSLLRTVLDGDVMLKQGGGVFYVTDLAAEQNRFDARETVHAGPIFGKKTFAARGTAAEREAAILAEFKLSPARFRAFGQLLSGTRRKNLIYVDDLQIQSLPHGLEFRFSLPAGSYATVLLREFMKNEGETSSVLPFAEPD
jgi:tRNA pseudouridine13 synthase